MHSTAYEDSKESATKMAVITQHNQGFGLNTDLELKGSIYILDNESKKKNHKKMNRNASMHSTTILEKDLHMYKTNVSGQQNNF